MTDQLTLPLPDLGVYSTIGRGLDAERVVALGEALVAQGLARGDAQACDVGWALQEFAREAGAALEQSDELQAEIDALKDQLGEAHGEITSEALGVDALREAMARHETEQREAVGKRKGRVDHPVAVPWGVLTCLLDSIRASAADEGVRSFVDKIEPLIDQAYDSQEAREKELALLRLSDRELLVRVSGRSVCDYARRSGWTRTVPRPSQTTSTAPKRWPAAWMRADGLSIQISDNPIESPGESFAALSELARHSGTTLRALLVDLVLAQ